MLREGSLERLLRERCVRPERKQVELCCAKLLPSFVDCEEPSSAVRRAIEVITAPFVTPATRREFR